MVKKLWTVIGSKVTNIVRVDYPKLLKTSVVISAVKFIVSAKCSDLRPFCSDWRIAQVVVYDIFLEYITESNLLIKSSIRISNKIRCRNSYTIDN